MAGKGPAMDLGTSSRQHAKNDHANNDHAKNDTADGQWGSA